MRRIETLEEWRSLFESSEGEPLIIFKHSNICPISKAALTRVEEGVKEKILPENIRLVIVQQSREISNKIADDLHIKHESPQIIIIKNKQQVYNQSHHEIRADEIAAHLK